VVVEMNKKKDKWKKGKSNKINSILILSDILSLIIIWKFKLNFYLRVES